MKKKIKNKKGFSLVEIIIYLAIFAMISIFVINSFINVMAAFNTTRINRDLLESGISSMERMSREIRQASSVDLVNSNLGMGILQLNSTDDLGSPMVIKFSKDVDLLNIYRSGVLLDNLLGSNVALDLLVFRHILTAQGEAIKIEMTVHNVDGRKMKTENFYNTIILKGSY